MKYLILGALILAPVVMAEEFTLQVGGFSEECSDAQIEKKVYTSAILFDPDLNLIYHSGLVENCELPLKHSINFTVNGSGTYRYCVYVSGIVSYIYNDQCIQGLLDDFAFECKDIEIFYCNIYDAVRLMDPDYNYFLGNPEYYFDMFLG